jgi:hypothetical protein
MSEQKPMFKWKSLLVGVLFIIPSALLLTGSILLLIYPPAQMGPDIILPAIAIIGLLVIGFLYWGIRAFTHKSVLNFPKKHLRRLLRTIVVLISVIGIGAGSIGIHVALQVRGIWLNDAGPYLTWDSTQDPTTAITICWQTNQPAASEVKYGVSATTLDENAGTADLNIFHQVALEGLLPNTTYYYQAGLFPVKQFRTAPVGDFEFTFLWWSDPRTNGDLPGAILGPNLPKIMSDLMKHDGSDWDFSVFTGDASTRAYNNDTWRIWVNDLATNDFASTRPHVVTPGNHERSGNKTAEIFMQYYPYDQAPGPAAFCFSFNYGNTHFVMMDPWDIASGWWGGDKTAYADWLRADLQANSDSKFIVMAMHPNPVLVGEHSGNQTAIMEVAREFGVDLILCGHHHSYHMFGMDGTELQPTEGPMTLDSMILMQGEGGNSGTPWIGSFSQIDVSSDQIRIRSRDVLGKWMDEFIITGN